MVSDEPVHPTVYCTHGRFDGLLYCKRCPTCRAKHNLSYAEEWTTFADEPPQRLVELKKPPRMIDLYDTAELLHRSKTGTELVVGIHKLTGETVVIKAIEHSIYNQQAKKLLGAAVEKYAKLNHPHICQLYESFDSLRLLLVLEAVEGVSLSEFMVHVGCTPPEAQQIMRQTCAAIRYRPARVWGVGTHPFAPASFSEEHRKEVAWHHRRNPPAYLGSLATAPTSRSITTRTLE